MQLELNGAIGSLHWRVVPSVLLHIIILTRVELHLLVGIVAAESVNASSVMDSREECLLLRQVLPDFHSHVVVVQVIVLCAISTHEIAALFCREENLSEVAGERLTILARTSPLELNLLL